MANPFYVQPALSTPSGRQALSGFGQILSERREMQQQQEMMQQMQQEVNAAFQSGDPNQIAQVSFKYPQISQTLMGQVNFRNEQTKQSMLDSMRRIAAGENPEQVITERVQMVQAQGGDPSDSLRELQMLQQIGPEQYRSMVTSLYAGTDPKGFEAMRSLMVEEKPETTASQREFSQYQDMVNRGDPLAEDFGRMVGAVEGKPNIDRAFETWLSMPEGPERDAYGQKAGFSKRETPSEARARIEQAKSLQSEITQTNETINLIDEFLANEQFIEDVSGISGRLPTLTPTGVDAEAAFNQIVDSLTLDNLGLMSGVLTDRDIQLLKNAASGLREGMSKERMRSRLSSIANKLRTKMENATQGLDVETITVDTPQQEWTTIGEFQVREVN